MRKRIRRTRMRSKLSVEDLLEIPKIKIEKLREDAFIPEKAYKTDSGYDCRIPDNLHLHANELKLVKLGFRLEIPNGWECQMRGRSGISTKYKVLFALGIGTIDSGYRGEIMVPFINLNNESVKFPRGTKMSQMVFKKVDIIRLEEDKVDTDTDRGTGGFGSTGLS
jgi:dUTP pyrophosphatase